MRGPVMGVGGIWDEGRSRPGVCMTAGIQTDFVFHVAYKPAEQTNLILCK